MNQYESGQSESFPPPISEETLNAIEEKWQENDRWTPQKMTNVGQQVITDITEANPNITAGLKEAFQGLNDSQIDSIIIGLALALDTHHQNNGYLLIDQLGRMDRPRIDKIFSSLRDGIKSEGNILTRVLNSPRISDINLSLLARKAKSGPIFSQLFLLGISTGDELVRNNWDILRPPNQLK